MTAVVAEDDAAGHCKICGQDYGDYDISFLPKQVEVEWRTFTKSGGPSGRYCKMCWGTCRHEKLAVDDVQEEVSDAEKLKLFMVKRQDRCLGKDKYTRVTKSALLEKAKKKFNKRFVSGVFTELGAYVAEKVAYELLTRIWI